MTTARYLAARGLHSRLGDCAENILPGLSRARGRSYSLTVDAISRVHFYDAPMLVRTGRLLDLDSLRTKTYSLHQVQPLPRGALFRDRRDAERYAAGIRQANRETKRS
jgi:hypothetical protein